MLYMKDEVFENLVIYELNRWATEIGAERSPVRQMLGGRMFDACHKYGIKNILALWCYGVTKTAWFSKAPTDIQGQMKWCEALAAEYARLGDIRLMIDLTPDELVTMTLVWTQASRRLDYYASTKKPAPPKLPTKPEPMPEPKKNPEPEVKKDEGKEVKAEPKPPDEKGAQPIEEPVKKSGPMKVIGIIAGVLAAIVAWLPIPAALASILKVIFNAIASIFK